jgi:hypothetical protein
MPRCDYFIGTRHLGSTQLPKRGEPLNSLAWFCESCGNTWARAVVEGATWSVEYNRCEPCGRAGAWDTRYPGSLLRQWFFTEAYLMERNLAMSLEALPDAVLAREVRIAFAHSPLATKAAT